MVRVIRFQMGLLASVGLALASGMIYLSASDRPAAVAADALKANNADDWKKVVTAKDLEGIVKVQLIDIEKATKAPGTFARGNRKMQTTGCLVATIGNIGTLVLEGDGAKKAAALRQAGLDLTSAAKKKNYNDAKQAAQTIAKYPNEIEPAADAKPAKWTDILPLDILMRGVSALDNESNAGIKDKKPGSFAKSSKDLGHKAILLACLAVVSREHKDSADWQGWCDEMREGALGLSKAFLKGSQPDSANAYKAMQKSCNDCHEKYRTDE